MLIPEGWFLDATAWLVWSCWNWRLPASALRCPPYITVVETDREGPPVQHGLQRSAVRFVSLDRWTHL